MTPPLQIGSTVRITCTVRLHSANNNLQQHSRQHRTVSRRAMLATLPDDDDDDGTCTLILEEMTPRPLHAPFKLTPPPSSPPSARDSNALEVQIPPSQILPLLPFELPHGEDEGASTAAETYKDCADRLSRLHDDAAAVSYYEAALTQMSSAHRVGETLVLRRKGRCVVAELDCVDMHAREDEHRYDVTCLLPDGTTEEDVVSCRDILTTVYQDETTRRGQREKSTQTFVQVRTMLNLSRSLLRLAEIDDIDTKPLGNRYRNAAVLGTSIAVALCEYHSWHADAESLERARLASLAEKARIVRSRAFLSLGKLAHAWGDAKYVLRRDGESRDAKELMRDIRREEKRRKRADRRLSRDVCRWVQSVVGGEDGRAAVEEEDV